MLKNLHLKQMYGLEKERGNIYKGMVEKDNKIKTLDEIFKWEVNFSQFHLKFNEISFKFFLRKKTFEKLPSPSTEREEY